MKVTTTPEYLETMSTVFMLNRVLEDLDTSDFIPEVRFAFNQLEHIVELINEIVHSDEIHDKHLEINEE